jgi:pimeloyl-ACP methyl ester carboxylesterase
VAVFVDRMAVETEGEGEPVLMIHGLGGTSNIFTPVLAAFARHRTIRFDLPGSGRSYRIEAPLSLTVFVEKARLVMQRLGVERAHVVAHSMGTIVATHLAAAEPGRIASLALFGPLLAPSDPARAAIRARAAQARAGDMQPIADALLRASVSAETRAKRPAAAAFVRESLMRQDPEGYARTCVAPPQAVRMMGERISGSRVEVLRGCGHWTPVEKPEECTGLLKRFLLERRPTWRTSSSRMSASSTPPVLSPTRARS